MKTRTRTVMLDYVAEDWMHAPPGNPRRAEDINVDRLWDSVTPKPEPDTEEETEDE